MFRAVAVALNGFRGKVQDHVLRMAATDCIRKTPGNDLDGTSWGQMIEMATGLSPQKYADRLDEKEAWE